MDLYRLSLTCLEPEFQMLQLGSLLSFPHPFHSEDAWKGDLNVFQVPKGKALCLGTQLSNGSSFNPLPLQRHDLLKEQVSSGLNGVFILLLWPGGKTEGRDQRGAFFSPLLPLQYILLSLEGNSESVPAFSMY